jgi:nucleoside-diphosphate-sugar epimerase
MTDRTPRDGRVLLTGAAGFVGHVLLAELLRRGHACAVMLRPPGAASMERLAALLGDLGIDAPALVAAGRLAPFEGALPDALPARAPLPVSILVHAAASTRFEPDGAGEPARTNDEGTQRLLDWSARQGILAVHLISTAFVGGAARGPALERVAPRPPRFNNAYEESKWRAEGHAVAWAERTGGSCTIHRPSIVVGDHATGRATRFGGVYLAFRASELLSQAIGDDPDGRRRVPLRIEGREDDPIDIVPVDHVARFVADVVGDRACHGRVYHVVHPDPPSNGMIRSAIEVAFGIGGGRFAAPEEIADADLNEVERGFHTGMRPLRPYMIDPPRFDRTNAAAVEARFGRRCPSWNVDALVRLIEHARWARWGRRAAAPVASAGPPADAYARYFEGHLRDRIDQSHVARMAALTATVRFVIEGVDRGEWVCRFEAGRLVRVQRGPNGVREDFGYRTSSGGFWDVVTARLDAQQVFLEGRAEMTGDVERALKFGFILRDFNREHPYDGTAAPAAAEAGRG